MWVDSRFHFHAGFMKGATTPFITLFQLLLWRHYILSGVHLWSESAELVGCHSRMPEWLCIAKDNDHHGHVKGLECLRQGDLWSQISHFQSVKPGLIWSLLITVRQFGEVSINAPVIGFYNCCSEMRQRTEVIKYGCNRVLGLWFPLVYALKYQRVCGLASLYMDLEMCLWEYSMV